MRQRRATIEDYKELINLRLAYLRTDYSALSKAQERQIRAQLPAYFAQHLEQDCFIYLAEEHEAIAACAFLLVSEKPANPTFPSGKTGAVMNVYTRPVYRRRGFARALMEQLIADARQMRLSYLELKATQEGLPLYQSLGFVREIAKYAPMRLVLGE